MMSSPRSTAWSTAAVDRARAGCRPSATPDPRTRPAPAVGILRREAGGVEAAARPVGVVVGGDDLATPIGRGAAGRLAVPSGAPAASQHPRRVRAGGSLVHSAGLPQAWYFHLPASMFSGSEGMAGGVAVQVRAPEAVDGRVAVPPLRNLHVSSPHGRGRRPSRCSPTRSMTSSRPSETRPSLERIDRRFHFPSRIPGRPGQVKL
jgi:hypothetical protein